MRRRLASSSSLALVSKEISELEAVEILRPIAAKMREAVDFLMAAKGAGSPDEHAIEECARVHARALKALPGPADVGERFLFDAFLIQAIGDEIRRSRLPIPTMIVPRYGRPWSFSRVLLGPALEGKNPAVDVVGFRGGPSLDAVNLLDYSWLIHELGHSAYRTTSDGFIALATSLRAQAVARRRARTISLQGSPLRRAQQLAEKMG
ncbi:MAG TPA: hypothetical protein VEI07_09390, partial [Planctomycetaceae bacterium]|nr:hypothetical protein [Planctomycetaceae bacterium]